MKRSRLNSGWSVGLALSALAIVCCLLPQPASAQAVSGTILGEVKDSSGAVVPGASVTLVNAGTGLTRTVVTATARESTRLPMLPTGTYTVSAEMSGFKKVQLANVHLGRRPEGQDRPEARPRADDRRRSRSRPRRRLLQTSSSDLSVTVEGKTIESLPLNGRNFVSLTRTIPGVTRGVGAGGGNIDGAGSLAWRASASFSANGQRPRDNNYMLDGVDNNETWLQTVVIFPSVDALDEFKLQTSTYAAEFGRSMGGVVNLQIKSGSNQFHGSAFEFLRNDSVRRQQLVQQPGGTGEARLQAAPVRRHHRRAHHQGQDVLLRGLPGDADHPGPDLPLHRALGADAPGQLLGDQPAHLRPPDRAALPGEHHSRRAAGIPLRRTSCSDLIPAPNTAGTRNALGQTINNYLINPQPGAAGQPVRRQGRPRAEREQPLLRPLQLPEDPPLLPATLPHGDAGTTFGARRREHQGPELRLQRHPHLQPDAG